MSAEIDSLDSQEFNLLDYASWAQTSGLWNGHHITLEEAHSFQEEVQSRIAMLIRSIDLNSLSFQALGAKLAWIGSSSENQPLLAREIQALGISSNGSVIQVNLGKSLSKFWKKHETAILIGLGVLTVITVVSVVAACSAGAAATGMALCGLKRGRQEDECLESGEPSSSVALVDQLLESVEIDGTIDYGKLLEKLDSKRGFPPADLLANFAKIQSTAPGNEIFPIVLNHSRNSEPLEAIGQNIIDPKTFSLDHFRSTIEPHPPRGKIGGINGMNTSLLGAVDHARYLSGFAANQNIDWVYNRGNGILRDFAEIFVLNYAGVSPNTAKELQRNWAKFHEENKDNPNQKYLQFCHSQGAIHVNNALESSDKQIRDRVIVVAIAPAKVVSRNNCYRSFNYASENDFVYLGEIGYASLLNSDPFETSILVEQAIENHEELILLPAEPNTTWPDHDFQSPTYAGSIRNHISGHSQINGEYK